MRREVGGGKEARGGDGEEREVEGRDEEVREVDTDLGFPLAILKLFLCVNPLT